MTLFKIVYGLCHVLTAVGSLPKETRSITYFQCSERFQRVCVYIWIYTYIYQNVSNGNDNSQNKIEHT